MPFVSRRVAIGCVLVVAWFFAGRATAQPSPAQQMPSESREPDVAINPRLEPNNFPPPVGYWVVDAPATAHAVAVKFGNIETRMTVKDGQTNYSYRYFGESGKAYDTVLKNVSEPGVRRLLFRADGSGEDWFTDSKTSRATHSRFQWALEQRGLELRYSEGEIVKAEFNTKAKEIRYPTQRGGFLIFVPQAKPNYSVMSQAFTNYFASLDAIMKTLPSVNSATGTVQAIDAWSLANETLCVAGERFAANYPEIYREPEPPPELVAIFGRMEELKTRYVPLSAGIGRLAYEFSAVPEVQETLKRFEKTIGRIEKLGRPPGK
jgi:hypothetical protein